MKRYRDKKKRRNVPVPIASMGDIAFLLIIFFMLLSEFAKDKDLELEPPISEKVVKAEVVVAARVAIDKYEQIYLDGQPVESPKDIEWGVRALLDKTVAEEQRHVEFKCHKSLPHRVYNPVVKAIAEGGGILEAVGEEP